MGNDDIVFRLRKRAEIRRQIPDRKSVQEGKPDRIADLLEEAANEIEELRKHAVDRTIDEIELSMEIADSVSFNNQDDIISGRIIDCLRWILGKSDYPGQYMYDPTRWSKR